MYSKRRAFYFYIDYKARDGSIIFSRVCTVTQLGGLAGAPERSERMRDDPGGDWADSTLFSRRPPISEAAAQTHRRTDRPTESRAGYRGPSAPAARGHAPLGERGGMAQPRQQDWLGGEQLSC